MRLGGLRVCRLMALPRSKVRREGGVWWAVLSTHLGVLPSTVRCGLVRAEYCTRSMDLHATKPSPVHDCEQFDTNTFIRKEASSVGT